MNSSRYVNFFPMFKDNFVFLLVLNAQPLISSSLCVPRFRFRAQTHQTLGLTCKSQLLKTRAQCYTAR